MKVAILHIGGWVYQRCAIAVGMLIAEHIPVRLAAPPSSTASDLLDRSGKPFVADFGLALREPDVGSWWRSKSPLILNDCATVRIAANGTRAKLNVTGRNVFGPVD